ncbi:Protein of unknown function [Cotesia congregata]|uniref:Phosphatidic acid phosphatase type 2/haloperoxidase domain-containing protein n=1 Tax=Cotesia congregata TaxID=51543 RepID=A0A8J2EA56_COTCN|nr:Protein of unknown function [Cotesia congregata]
MIGLSESKFAKISVEILCLVIYYYRGNFSRPKNAVISAITHLQSAKLDYINLPQGNYYEYVQELSFPSSHSSVVTYCGVYLIV